MPPLRERLLGSRANASEASPTRPPAGRVRRRRRETVRGGARGRVDDVDARGRAHVRERAVDAIDRRGRRARAREATGVRASRVDFVAWLETEGLAYSQTKKRRLAAANGGGRR